MASAVRITGCFGIWKMDRLFATLSSALLESITSQMYMARCLRLSAAMQGVYEDDESIHLVMELCAGGGILDCMKDGTLTEARVADIIRSAFALDTA